MAAKDSFSERIRFLFEEKYPALSNILVSLQKKFPAVTAPETHSDPLSERNKELFCIHAVSQIINTREYSVDLILNACVDLTPQSLQYPHMACAEIVCCDKLFQTDNFKDTSYQIKAEIPLGYFSGGQIIIGYIQKPNVKEKEFFLKEENALIQTLAQIIGTALQNRRYEVALTESESKYQRFFKNSAVGILRTSASGDILEINNAFAEIMGFSEASNFTDAYKNIAEICKNPEELFLFSDNDRRQERIKKIRTTVIHRRGYAIRLEIDAVRLQEGDQTYFDAVVKDITEQEKAKSRLADSEKKYRALLDSANDAIFTVEGDSEKIVQCNKRAEKLLGRSRDDIIGRHFSEAHPEDKRDEYIRGFRKQLRSRESLVGHFFVQNAKGKNIPAEISSVVVNIDGKPLNIGIFRDLTERKQNEYELKAANEEMAVMNERLKEMNEELNQSNELLNESEKKFRAIFDNINDAVGLHKIKNNRIGPFLEVNRKACEIFGYSHSEFLKMYPEDMIAPNALDDTFAYFEKLVKEGRVRTETYNRKKNGEVFPAEINALIFEMGGEHYLTAVTRDISQQKANRERIKKSREHYHKLSSLTFEGILIHKKGILQDANQSFYNMFGYSEGELKGKNIIDLLADQDSKNIIYQNVSKKVAEPYEITVRRKDGSAFYAEIEGRDLESDEGLRVAAVRDISERKKAREMIKKTNQRLKKLNDKLKQEKERAQKYLDVAGVMILALDTEGRVSMINKKALEILEVNEHDVIGKPWFDNFVPQDQRQNVHQVFKSTAQSKSKELQFFENEIITASGERRTIQWHNVYLRDEQGNPGGVLSSGLDITREREAQKQLQKSERKFRNIFNFSYIGIALGDAQGRTIEVNNRFAEMLKYTPEEMKGIAFGEFTHPEDLEAENQLIQKLLKGKKDHYTTEKRYLNKNGKPIWVDLTVTALRDRNNTIEFFIGMVMDISERKKREFLLKKNQKELKELNATKDKFFSIIAHDLKNPFGQLVGFSDLLLKNIKKGRYEKIYDFARVINESSNHGMKLLENLLQWARAQTDRIQFNPEQLLLRELVQEAVNDTHSAALNKKIEVQNLVADELSLAADAEMLKTIVRNLLSNAVKYSYPDSEIRIFSSETDDMVSLIIDDSGVGMKSEVADNLFNIEENVSVKGTANETGTGLGLILCKEFVEKHGGSIHAESSYGKGSTFTVELPRNDFDNASAD